MKKNTAKLSIILMLLLGLSACNVPLSIFSWVTTTDQKSEIHSLGDGNTYTLTSQSDKGIFHLSFYDEKDKMWSTTINLNTPGRVKKESVQISKHKKHFHFAINTQEESKFFKYDKQGNQLSAINLDGVPTTSSIYEEKYAVVSNTSTGSNIMVLTNDNHWQTIARVGGYSVGGELHAIGGNWILLNYSEDNVTSYDQFGAINWQHPLIVKNYSYPKIFAGEAGIIALRSSSQGRELQYINATDGSTVVIDYKKHFINGERIDLEAIDSQGQPIISIYINDEEDIKLAKISLDGDILFKSETGYPSDSFQNAISTLEGGLLVNYFVNNQNTKGDTGESKSQFRESSAALDELTNTGELNKTYTAHPFVDTSSPKCYSLCFGIVLKSGYAFKGFWQNEDGSLYVKGSIRHFPYTKQPFIGKIK